MADKPSYLNRGRKSWTNAPRSADYGNKWYEEFDYLETPKNPNKPKEIRPVGGQYTIAMHFLKFKKKDGGQSGFYVVCPDFDSISGEFKPDGDRTCPVCRDFADSELPDEIRSYASLRHYTDAFDLERVRKGVQDGCFGVVVTNKYGAGDIIKIAETMNGVDVDDPANGISLHWFLNKKAKDAKDRVSFTKGDKVPVMWSEKKKLFGIKYQNKVFTGAPTDFAAIIEVKSPKELEKDLQRIGMYKKLREWHRSQGSDTSGGVFGSAGAAASRSDSADSSRTPDDNADWGGDSSSPSSDGFDDFSSDESPGSFDDFGSSDSSDTFSDDSGGSTAADGDGWDSSNSDDPPADFGDDW